MNHEEKEAAIYLTAYKYFGLSIAQQISEKRRAEAALKTGNKAVALAAEKQAGSLFDLVFPAAPAEAQKAQQEATPADYLASMLFRK